MNYALRPGLSFCTSGERTVFLDLNAGRYFALATDRYEAFQRWAMGFSPVEADHTQLGKLAQSGILILVDEQPPPLGATNVQTASPQRELDLRETNLSLPAVTSAVAARLLWAWRARHWPMSRMVQALRRPADGGSVILSQPDGLKLRKTMRAFEIADLLLGSQDRCLERSLALAATCRKQGLPVSLVIGVQTDPFSAHCWVQDGTFVLNERPDRAQMFTPILAI